MATFLIFMACFALAMFTLQLLQEALTQTFHFLMSLNAVYLRVDRFFQSGWLGRIAVGGGLLFGAYESMVAKYLTLNPEKCREDVFCFSVDCEGWVTPVPAATTCKKRK